MTYTVAIEDDALEFKVLQPLNNTTVFEIKKQWLEAINSAKSKTISIDLSSCQDIDLAGFNLVVISLERCKSLNKNCGLKYQPESKIVEFLHLSKLTPLFEVDVIE